jgi:hypothetical protein
MTPRLASGLLASALLRRVNDAGGMAMVLAKGDAISGAFLFVALSQGQDPRAFERGIGPDGESALVPAGPQPVESESALTDYWQRRRARDPDLWVIELNIANAERFVAETMSIN